MFWAFSFFVIFESFVQIGTGIMRNRGILNVRWATIIGGIVCGVVGYGILAQSTSIWEAYLGYAVLGGIGSGMVYSSCINIVAKWYPEKKGWRTGFVNGGWAYGAVPFIFAIGAASSGGGAITMSASTLKTYIWIQASIMTFGIVLAGFFLKDPPKNWWPKEVDPLNWQKHSTRDLRNNPPALRHYNLGEMWRTPQAKWVGIQYALYIGCSLFGVAYYYSFAQAMGLGIGSGGGRLRRVLAGGRHLPADLRLHLRVHRPTKDDDLRVLAERGVPVARAWFGELHNAPLFILCAVISGGLSGANFPMTAAMVADYWGETNNAVNYGSIYAFKALGGSFAGGVAALIMTGTLYGTATFHWAFGFFFGAALGALAALTLIFFVKRPTVEQMARAVRASAEAPEQARPAVA